MPNAKRRIISHVHAIDYENPDFNSPVFPESINAVKSLSIQQMKKIANGMNKFTNKMIKRISDFNRQWDEENPSQDNPSDILKDFFDSNENQNFRNN